MHALKIAVVAATLVGGASLISSAASAMPVSGLAGASSALAADVQNVRWVCGPYRCWWRPNYWGPYWGYRRWWGPRWGWRRW